MARARQISRARSQKRKSIWFDFAVGPVTLAANALTIASSLTAEGFDEIPLTVVRTRGLITIWSDQTAASEIVEGIYGTIVVKNTAVLIGASAVPDPLNEASDDWFTYQPMHSGATRQVGGAGSFNEVTKTEYAFDSKAMRKVDFGDDIVHMIRNTSGTDGLIFLLTGRMFVKLH